MPIGFIAGMLAVTALLGWPDWMWFPLTAVVAGSLLLDMYLRNGRGRAAPEDEEAPDITEFSTEPPYLETTVVDVPVPSGLAEYPFLFSSTVRWRTDTDPLVTSHGNPGALAVASVLRRVEQYTEAEHPSRADFLCHWLEGLLGRPVQDETGTVTAYANDVRLHLRKEDRNHLEELEEHRRNIGSWEQQREYERSRRAYFGEDVLRSPGSAVVWWLSRHEDEIERATDLIGPLSCLAAAANDSEIPDPYLHLLGGQASPGSVESPNGLDHPQDTDAAAAHQDPAAPPPDGQPQARLEPVSALLDSMGITRGSEERDAFVHRLARMMEVSGRPQAAEHLRGTLVAENVSCNGDSVSEPTRDAPRSEPEEPSAPRPSEPPAEGLRQPSHTEGSHGAWWSTQSPPPDPSAPPPWDSNGPPSSVAEQKEV
ncbi:hypothetical protein K4749_38775 [Streptomyces sp. TRM72054]|uniref:hypothetical protein n=1 Tax=Streptomyces sp. TRM72054 TaxID=2870562 RepID=UPI001C8B563A|nr:hypothetical protein [Streptomyces sp. TRM72054]MBX9399342.1 hypothetical protein [Streptomyces sp. TRM72054]